MTEAFIYDAVRTPRGKGKQGGALNQATPIYLAATALRALRDRNSLDTSKVDDVVLGCVEPVGEQGADIARVAALYADYATSAPGVTVSRFCASGLEACNQAAAQIMSGQADLVVGGGVESMSRVPMFSSGGAWPIDPQVAAKTGFVPQGISADLIATKWGFSRHDVDAYAAESQRRAKAAWDEGRFARSIVPVKDINGLVMLDRDEYMRPETTMESLAQLKPAFQEQGEKYGFNSVMLQRYPEVERINHVHHAGNSSGIVDGAAAVLFGTREMGKALGLKPRARIRSFASIGSEPSIMLTGPSYAAEKALKRVGMKIGDIDLFELNEAFAAVVLRFMQVLDVSHDRMNVNGGAIAMGHPLGATGAMILGTLLDELERRNLSTGLATLCVGAGMGTATIIEGSEMLNYSVDAEGIATVEFDYPDKAQNILNETSMGAYARAMQQALADPAVKGIVVASAKKDFIAGGDLAELGAATDAAAFHAAISDWHKFIRAVELAGKPVAAALNGTTLGGGMEVALGCHYRVAADNPKARFGFPEVTLGLLPGAGGTQRVPRLTGMMAAAPLLMEGKRIKAAEAQKIGMIHAVAKVGDERTAARQWVLDAVASGTKPLQPWDMKGFKIPGGGPNTPNGMQMLMAANAMLREKTYDNYPAPKHILSCVYEGLSTNLDTGLAIEARYFTNLVMSPVSKNMIRSLFFGMNEANKLSSRPTGVAQQKYTRIGMLGAGMMGAGIAMSTATAGIDIVLLDTSQEAAEKGKAYARKQWSKQIQRGRMTAEAMEALLARIHPTADYADLAGCEMVIEAVFEKREIKAEVTKKTEAVIAADAIFASNTSTLPITGLAEASVRPANFIGLHFFSPAEKMPLVEIIVGKATSDATLARSMDYVRAIGKTPIVVNDSRGFYTSRVFGTYVSEGMALLEEGVPPALIDKAGLIAGMPVGPLALADEVSIELVHKIAQQTRADLGSAYVERAADRVAAKMVANLGRLGRKSGAGFYDYPVDGPKHLWPGLAEQFPPRVGADGTAMLSLDEIVERLILVQSVETARCLEEKVLRAPIDADVGAILGWGYPPFRGGPIGWLHTLGMAQAVTALDRLAERHGARFAPPKLLRDMAARGERFYPA